MTMDNFKTKTFEAIENAIANNKTSAKIYTNWISDEMAELASDPFIAYLMFSPDGNSEVKQSIEGIFEEVSDYVFDKYKCRLSFGGCNFGSVCAIYKSQECKSEVYEKSRIVHKQIEQYKQVESSRTVFYKRTQDILSVIPSSVVIKNLRIN